MDTKLLKNIDIVKEYIKKTKRLHNKNKDEFIYDEKTYLSVSMSLFTILNEIIEIGEKIIEIEDLITPQSYREIFQILKNNNIIKNKLSKKLELAMKDRNMIAHQYSTFDIEKIFELSENVEIFEEFIKEILTFLNKKNSKF